MGNTILVKINRSSIKKNPNAGRDTHDIAGPWELTGIIDGDIPDHLKEHLTPTAQEMNPVGTITRTEFIVNDKLPEVALMLKDAGIDHSFDREVHTVYSKTPEPDYLYEYEDPLIQCNECGKESKVSEVDNYNDDGFYHPVCPHCNNVDCFDNIEHESINDALKSETDNIGKYVE